MTDTERKRQVLLDKVVKESKKKGLTTNKVYLALAFIIRTQNIFLDSGQNILKEMLVPGNEKWI